MSDLTMDQVFDIQAEIFDNLKGREKDLIRIRESEEPIIVRWQAFIGTVLPIQIEVVARHGFSADQAGLSSFNNKLMKFNQEHAELRKINEKKWEYLLDKAFGVTNFRKITLKDAQDLIGEIADSMVSESFLEKVDQVKKLFGEELSMVDKRKHLLEIIFPLHMQIMEKHGFIGDTGYVEAQRAIMDFYYDPMIMKKAIKAQHTVFQRAGL